MSYKALHDLIERENMFRGFRDQPKIDKYNITKADADELFESIDCGLSPENLHCDGEISHAQARAKYRDYMQAVSALKELGFEVPKSCYEIE